MYIYTDVWLGGMQNTRALVAILEVLDNIAADDRFIGPARKIPQDRIASYISEQLECLKIIVSMSDWRWDTCGVGRVGETGEYDFTRRLCDDKDNPLYYYQSEYLFDDLDGTVDEYYPGLTSSEEMAILSEKSDHVCQVTDSPRHGMWFLGLQFRGDLSNKILLITRVTWCEKSP